ncbi:oxidoreductase, partial [Rhodococcus aetherivorans]
MPIRTSGESAISPPYAHLALHLPNGVVREYSLCSDPRDTTRWTVA